MILTLENIVHYLLDKGLITPESIVNGQFSVRDHSSRNTNFAVNREYAPAFLVKQVRAKDREKMETMRTEATCYWLAENDEQYRALRTFLPKYYEYDYLNHILIIELLPDVHSLHEYYRQMGFFNVEVAGHLAHLLSSFHTHAVEDLEQSRSYSLFRKSKPWVFSLPDSSPKDMLDTAGNAEKQALQLMWQNAEFLTLLKKAAEPWEIKSLIHGDVKFTNFIIDREYDNAGTPDIRLIDWELADLGDPLWDAAAVFQNYLSLWAMSEASASSFDAADASQQPYRLKNLQPSMLVFWECYARNAGWTPEEAHEKLLKTIGFTALKLVHTCFEAAPYARNMQAYSARMLQLSFNMLRSPERAVTDLLGFQKSRYHATESVSL